MSNLISESSVSDEKQTIWNKAFISIFVINFILNMGQFMMNTLIPKYAEHLGASAAIVGMVSGMFAVTALCVRPVVGPATSYFKKNRLLAVTTGIIIMSFVFYGFASSIPMIIAGRLLHGMGMGFLAPVTLALASNALPESKMASGIGIFSLGQAVSTAIGPTLGLKLVKMVGYNKAFLTAAALLCIAFLLSFKMETEEPDKTSGFKITINNMIDFDVIIPAILMFFLGGAYSCISTFIVVYGGVCGVEDIGLFFTAYAVCLLFTRPISGKIADKYGIEKTVIPGIIIFALSFIVVSFSRTLPMFILSGAISAFGYGICQPAIQSLCMSMVPKERRGIAGNTGYMGVDTSYLIIPPIAGTIVTLVQQNGGSKVLGYAVMYRIMIIPILIALVIFLVKGKSLQSKSGK